MRTCDAARARAAAETFLRGVERLNVEPPTAEQQATVDQTREQLTKAVKLLAWGAAHKVAQKWGPHWEMEEAEADAIAQPALELIEQYLGSLTDSPWSRLYLALGMYAAPRILNQLTSAPRAPAPTPAPASTPTVDVEATVTKEKAAA